MEKVLKNQRGATMVEYCIMLGAILAVCVLAVTALGLSTNGLFELLPPVW
jgi:Flp pilus assembly pilin Flp